MAVLGDAVPTGNGSSPGIGVRVPAVALGSPGDPGKPRSSCRPAPCPRGTAPELRTGRACTSPAGDVGDYGLSGRSFIHEIPIVVAHFVSGCWLSLRGHIAHGCHLKVKSYGLADIKHVVTVSRVGIGPVGGALLHPASSAHRLHG